MTWAALQAAARAAGLALRGAFHPGPRDAAPAGSGTLVLLGPDEPRFWPPFTRSPEYLDGAPDPLDRWSKRVAGELAAAFGGEAVFPYDGPPYAPFLHWAARGGQAWVSPVGLLVDAQAGLWISYRAALALPALLDLPPAPEPVCDTCADRPCAGACPVGALAPGGGYDVAACKAHLATPEGADCRQEGCRVRRACPVSARFGREPAQSAFHMRAFLGE